MVSPREMLFRKIPKTASPKQQIKLYAEGRLESKLMLTCDVRGKREGRNAAMTLWTQSPTGSKACEWIPGTNDVSWMTSVPASIFSLMLLRDQVHHFGVFPPEVFTENEVAIFYKGIKEWGITVVKQLKSSAK